MIVEKTENHPHTLVFFFHVHYQPFTFQTFFHICNIKGYLAIFIQYLPCTFVFLVKIIPSNIKSFGLSFLSMFEFPGHHFPRQIVSQLHRQIDSQTDRWMIFLPLLEQKLSINQVAGWLVLKADFQMNTWLSVYLRDSVLEEH